jgi:pyruvate dehydrogenase E2 component (dihydrolipoamide acetyltransferase)
MAIEIQVPKLGLTMEEATLVTWKFAAGASVRKDDIVLVLETDKVTYEMPSPGDGLLHPMVAPGSTILVGQVVGYLAADKAELASMAAEHPAAAVAAPAKPAEPGPEEAALGREGAPEGATGRVPASPLARAMAMAHGLELARITGSGPGGRVVKTDVLRALEAKETAKPAAAPAVPAGGFLSPAEEVPISGIRKVIFRNMHLSLATQAQLTLHTEASASALIDLRRRLNATGASQVSFNAIFVKVLAQALKQHPYMNASVDGEVIKVWRQVHVGVAVDLGHGLIVPKVRDADTKSIRAIALELDRLVEAAKANTLGPDDLTSGTFTLTNLGAWDIDEFTPIVNHPESGILGVGRMVKKPAVRDDQVVIEPFVSLSLSFDHRIIDGAAGAAFLKTVKDMIEDPLLML